MIDPRELATHAGEIRQRGIGTTTVGVGEDFDEGLLSAMAEAGGGNFKYVANPAELREFFSEELQELFTVHATGFTIGFTCPHGARAELVSAFPVTRNGKRFEVAIGDVAARDEIDLVFTVRVNPGAMTTTVPFAVTAAWTDPRRDQRHQATIALEPLNRAARSDVTNAPADPLVQERSALQKAAAERRIALDLDRQGRYRESRARMGDARMYLLAAPMTEDVAFDLQESDSMASFSDDMAYSQHDRKAAQEREYHRRRGRLETARRVEESRSREVEKGDGQ
jgi:Ca-activated chloride channel family protein